MASKSGFGLINPTANVMKMFKQKSVSDWDEVLFLKCLIQNAVFDSQLFKFFTAIVDDFFPNWSIFRHLLSVSKIYNRPIVQIGRVVTNGPRDRGSIPDQVILKTQKMVLDAALLNTQHYKVRNKGKVEQSREKSSALPYISV